jgi:glycosyltransferase involved in cell wall biosynthesis
MTSPRYLFVTHVPFARNAEGSVLLDSWLVRDLEGIAASGWPLRVCAPELASPDNSAAWARATETIPAHSTVQFAGFPPISHRSDPLKWFQIRRVLRREVSQADLVHTSNFFAPYEALSYAHDLAVRSGKKTVFVISEDFHDLLEWEWVRRGTGDKDRAHRARHLAQLDHRVRASAATASLTLLHTPAAVARYRLCARNGLAIRQPGHAAEDVISESDFNRKSLGIRSGAPLALVSVCRHKALKGLDLLLWAIHLLRERGVAVQAELYGAGEQSSDLQALARRLELDQQVSFPGALPPGPATYDAIARGHLFVMPHRTSDFGRAFFDAMAGGTPVLAFRTPASADTVREGVDGLLAPCDDIEGYAAAIERFHHDRQLLVRCSCAARSRALQNTRTEWFRLRALWINSLFAQEAIHV